ncbi:MAG: hypothetical protein AAFQ98_24020, partial [Bacteroidota bacterium]
ERVSLHVVQHLSGFVVKDQLEAVRIFTENIFWAHCKQRVTFYLITNTQKKKAIQAYYEEIGLTEEMYPIENCYRNLDRKGLKWRYRQSKHKLSRRRSVSDEIAKDILSLLRQGFSQRKLERLYGVDQTTIHRLVKDSETCPKVNHHAAA